MTGGACTWASAKARALGSTSFFYSHARTPLRRTDPSPPATETPSPMTSGTCDWEYSGNFLGIFREFLGKFLGISWEFPGNIQGISWEFSVWEFPGKVPGNSWEFPGNSWECLGISWECLGMPGNAWECLGISWECLGIPGNHQRAWRERFHEQPF